jgi:translation initiation factor IF-2
MSEEKMMRLSQVARKLNVGISTVADYLATKGHKIEVNPNTKITMDQMNVVEKEFASSEQEKKEASELKIGKKHHDIPPVITEATSKPSGIQKNPLGDGSVKVATPEVAPTKEVETEEYTTKVQLQGIKVLGKIDLNQKKSSPIVAAPVETIAPVIVEAPKVEAKITEEKVADAPKEPEAIAPVIETSKVEVPKTEEVKTPEVAQKVVAQKIEQKAVVKTPEVVKPKVEQSPKVAAKKPEEVVATKTPTIENKAIVNETPPVVATSEATVNNGSNEVIEAKADQLKGLTVLGKIELPTEKSKKPNGPLVANATEKNKKKRKRLKVNVPNPSANANNPIVANGPKLVANIKTPLVANKKAGERGSKMEPKQEVSSKEIQEKLKSTLAKLGGGGNKAAFSNRAKYKRDKRSAFSDARDERALQDIEDAKTLKVSEFVSASDLASMMEVSVNEVISTCMGLGMFVSINQRLDAEAITIIADEFNYLVEFVSAEAESEDEEEVDAPESLTERAPIVTIMGHVDHGKTSLLDYIRRANVTASEAGGITQHIGAYDVKTANGKRITFLDTPGHEAFTAMRARGAKLTDIVIIVVAADDGVMPQTREAINHALNAGVPIIIAINKIDKPGANPDKIREALSVENILVEQWGGKYQSEEISAKSGIGIPELLEKILLEAEILELKANANKPAIGTVIEATLDKGRGHVTTIMVQSGTLRIGDVLLAGHHFGKVKAMLDYKGKKLKEAGPSTPVLVLGLSGAPQAGDRTRVMETDRAAREIATKREQILREQNIRTKKHITLDEIGRRLAIGNFKQLNLIVKGDVDGSVEALTDSLLKLSTQEIAIAIIHKGVGQISESDVLLASASDAIIIGFQVRPSPNARKIAENEQIEIRHYSIIYDAIDEVKDAMEGMLEPKVEEVIIGTIEVRDVFKITKVGTVAGCYVTSGHVRRKDQVRLVRDGIVVHTGNIDALKRFKEDVSEVKNNYECGLSFKNFHDIQEGDTIEAFEQKETKRKL